MKLLPIFLAVALMGVSGNLQAATVKKRHSKARSAGTSTRKAHGRKQVKAHPVEASSSVAATSALPGIPGLAPTAEAHLEGLLPANLSSLSPETQKRSSIVDLSSEIRPILSSVPAPQAPDMVAALLDKAKTYLGTPYRYGGTTPKGFDCSGFVSFVFASSGLNLEHSSVAQAHQGEAVALGHIQPGDLLFFKTRGASRSISHVGIYLGEGRFIHAATWGGGVEIASLSSDYYARRFVSARRVTAMKAFLQPAHELVAQAKDTTQN